jgi:hypothetical protein
VLTTVLLGEGRLCVTDLLLAMSGVQLGIPPSDVNADPKPGEWTTLLSLDVHESAGADLLDTYTDAKPVSLGEWEGGQRTGCDAPTTGADVSAQRDLPLCV